MLIFQDGIKPVEQVSFQVVYVFNTSRDLEQPAVDVLVRNLSLLD